jgi:phosphatidylserine/phosphatidylglycerophosphate/cardiolipin synthase-like enzyme
MYGVSFFKALAPFLFVSLVLAKQPSIDPSQCIIRATELLLQEHNVVDALFFTPDDAQDVKHVLIGLIESETTYIRAALFRFTDTDIAKALIRAKERGVDVEIVIDSGGVALTHYSKVHTVASVDVPIYIYQSMCLRNITSRYQSIMHHKTFIFENSIGGSVVFFGSLNPTHAAFNGNEEASQVRNAAPIVSSFKEHFEKLKHRSHRYEMIHSTKKLCRALSKAAIKVLRNVKRIG